MHLRQGLEHKSLELEQPFEKNLIHGNSYISRRLGHETKYLSV